MFLVEFGAKCHFYCFITLGNLHRTAHCNLEHSSFIVQSYSLVSCICTLRCTVMVSVVRFYKFQHSLEKCSTVQCVV